MTEVNRLYCWIWNLAVLWGNFWRYSNFKEFYSACGVWTCILPFTGGFTVCVFLRTGRWSYKTKWNFANYKYLPHANELFDGVSQFVLTRKVPVLFSVSFLHNEWACQSSGDKNEGVNQNQKLTQIVCIVFYDYNIKETGFSKFLPEVPKEGNLC